VLRWIDQRIGLASKERHHVAVFFFVDFGDIDNRWGDDFSIGLMAREAVSFAFEKFLSERNGILGGSCVTSIFFLTARQCQCGQREHYIVSHIFSPDGSGKPGPGKPAVSRRSRRPKEACEAG